MDFSRVEDTHFRVNRYLKAGDRLLDLSIPKIMGILNITPDSFYSDSRAKTTKDLIIKAERMILEGADILDLGAYSSRPGANDVSIEEEKTRILPALKVIRKEFPKAIISVDTFRSEIARVSLGEGVQIINDISAGKIDKEMYSVVAQHKAAYIAMHMKGTPQTMITETNYSNFLNEIFYYFSQVIHEAEMAGCHDILIDPGFGFSKTLEQNYQLLNDLDELMVLAKPIVVGISRKSMIYKKLNTSSKGALNGTTVLNTRALLKGASVLRVHDVKEAKEIISLLF